MDAHRPDAVAEAADDARVERDLLELFHRQLKTSLVGNIVVGSITVVVLWLGQMRGGLGLWFGAVLAIVLVRGLHGHHLGRRIAAADAAGLAALRRELTLLMAATGLIWGLLPWLSYHGDNPLLDFFSIAMLLGMSAGAVQSAAPVPMALRSYIVLAFAPFVVKSAFIGGSVYLAGGLIILFTIAVWLSYAKAAYRMVHETLQARRTQLVLADALARERDAVRTAMRAKDLFLAGVSHDLRQPVHAITLHLYVLRSLKGDQLNPEQLERSARPIETACETMNTHLERLLELSRLESGEAKARRAAMPAAQLIDSLRATFEAQADSRSLQLRIWVADGAVFDTDPRMMQSMAHNLVGNAVRYTQQGGVLIAVRPWQGGWRLGVYDTGPGFDEARWPEMCTPYRRFDDRESHPDGAGQGLGLALVERQARLLGHRLQVRSRPGRGSAFSLFVPAASR